MNISSRTKHTHTRTYISAHSRTHEWRALTHAYVCNLGAEKYAAGRAASLSSLLKRKQIIRHFCRSRQLKVCGCKDTACASVCVCGCVYVAEMMPQSALEHQEMKILFKPFYQHNRKSFCTFRIKVAVLVLVLVVAAFAAVAIKDQLSSAYNLLLDLSSCSSGPGYWLLGPGLGC